MYVNICRIYSLCVNMYVNMFVPLRRKTYKCLCLCKYERKYCMMFGINLRIAFGLSNAIFVQWHQVLLTN